MRLSLLGSTGSIGRQTLDVVSSLNAHWRNGLGKIEGQSAGDTVPCKLTVLAVKRNIRLLEEQARQFLPELVCVGDENAGRSLKTVLADTPVTVRYGEESILEAASFSGADTVLNALAGVSGLRPTLSALAADKRLLLANKESLVCGGELVMNAAREPVIPVDSEHSAVFQLTTPPPCGSGGEAAGVVRVILTASGGAFLGYTTEQLRSVTPEMALSHPTWRMGPKITVDCSTLLNKGFEVIEAMHLFGLPPEKVAVMIHPESIIHALTEYTDGATIAHMALPDMRLPIQYALTYPHGRRQSPVPPLDLIQAGKLTFAEPDRKTFPCLALAERAARAGGNAGAVLCGAGESAVNAFLSGRCGFLDIPERIERALDTVPYIASPSVEDIFHSVETAFIM